MRDITNKNNTLRYAKASAYLYCHEEVLRKVQNKEIPKGDVLELARASGMLAAKKTYELIPHCHIIPIEYLDIQYEFLNREIQTKWLHSEYSSAIQILVTAKTIAWTGIKMEVLTCVSVTALVLYDLLKPLNLPMEISHVKLLEKKGGKTDPKFAPKKDMNACILVCSDSTAKGKRKNSSGLIIKSILEEYNIAIHDYQIVPDDILEIQSKIKTWVEQGVTFIFTTGGTGLSPKDLTVEAVVPLLEKQIPGISEVMHIAGNERTPWAMLSRSVAV